MEKIDLSTKFAWKLKFHENRGKFEIKLSYLAVIKYIRGIKFLNLYLKILFSPSLISLTPSQTDGTKIGRKLVPEPTSYQCHSA